jgi:hypothetical protein
MSIQHHIAKGGQMKFVMGSSTTGLEAAIADAIGKLPNSDVPAVWTVNSISVETGGLTARRYVVGIVEDNEQVGKAYAPVHNGQ